LAAITTFHTRRTLVVTFNVISIKDYGLTIIEAAFATIPIPNVHTDHVVIVVVVHPDVAGVLVLLKSVMTITMSFIQPITMIKVTAPACI
jgi:hypothetical protein